MRKSVVNLVTVLKGSLIEFPALVTSLEEKEFSFLEKLFSWIKNTEDILTTHNISEVSEISGLRSKIIAPKFALDKRISLRKAQIKMASEVLYALQHTVLSVLNPYEAKIEESRETIRQLLIIVRQAEAIKYDKNKPFDHLVNEIWFFVVSNEQLSAGAVKLQITLSMTDIHLLLAEEINLEDFQ